MSAERAQLFVSLGENVPLWFKKYDWGLALELTSTSFLPADLGLVDVEHKSFTVKVSNPARAACTQYLSRYIRGQSRLNQLAGSYPNKGAGSP